MKWNYGKARLTSNSSLLIAKKNQVISELDYKKIKSRNYPYVKLNAGYGYTANWYEVGTTDLQRRLGLNYGVTVASTYSTVSTGNANNGMPDTDSEPRIAHIKNSNWDCGPI